MGQCCAADTSGCLMFHHTLRRSASGLRRGRGLHEDLVLGGFCCGFNGEGAVAVEVAADGNASNVSMIGTFQEPILHAAAVSAFAAPRYQPPSPEQTPCGFTRGAITFKLD